MPRRVFDKRISLVEIGTRMAEKAIERPCHFEGGQIDGQGSRETVYASPGDCHRLRRSTFCHGSAAATASQLRGHEGSRM